MILDTRKIVDDHFTQNYNYYRGVCFKYYRGRYLFEDLLNEVYLKVISVKPETVERLNNAGKLNYAVLRLIGDTFRKRKTKCNRASAHYEGSNNSSPLFETPNTSFVEYLENILVEDSKINEIELQDLFEKATEVIDKTLQEQSTQKKGKSNYLKVKLFLEVQRTNINQISKTTGISRPFITQTYKESQQYLQEQILK